MTANDNTYTGSQNRFASMSRDELIVQCQKLCSMDDLRKEAFRLEPHDQYRLAAFIAANVGYVLTVEPEYPDSPHNRIDWFEVAGEQGARAMAAEEAMRNSRNATIEECIRIVAGVMKIDPDSADGPIFDALRTLKQYPPIGT